MKRVKENQPSKYNTSLTDKQRETLVLIGQEMTDAQIAAKLGIVHKTVSFRVDTLYNKLALYTREELVAYAKKHYPTEEVSETKLVSKMFPGLID